ncbi:hypothetical protein ABE65_004890 [Fictibacillus phosphorivorans]|uniref:Uncharacterized protein n=1 Tax=Fictibacillus phosphorivorans TaxID=1221500 RepID=A0A160IJW7_9BACL|nr:hypothetical protein [Fictibacillus phosphorivorans]ANC76181.1 hypothetical protein ABE65_004890 [Fictibacillus phosphorivorans]
MKRFVQLVVFAAGMSIPAIVSADSGGILSPVTSLTKETTEIVESVPDKVNISTKDHSVSDEVVKPTLKTVTTIVKDTTRAVDRVDQTVNKVTETVKPVNEAVKTVTNTVDTVKEIVPTETLKQSKPIVDVELSEKPSIKVDVVDQEVNVTVPVTTEKPQVEVKIPVVSEIVTTKPEVEEVVEAKPEPAPISKPVTEPVVKNKPIISDKVNETNDVNLQKSEAVMKKEMINMEIENPVNTGTSGDVLKKSRDQKESELPIRHKTSPDYPITQMLTPSSQGGQTPTNSSNGPMTSSSTITFLAILDGGQSDTQLETGVRLDGGVRHYYDQWLNAPPGQPPQSFFF